MNTVLIASGFLVFLIVTIFSFFIYSKIKKINRLIHQIREIKGEIKKPFAKSGNILNDTMREVEALSEERKEEIEQLKKLETYRREFLGNVSHELKTPIFNIQGYINTLLDGGLEDEKINREYLKRADRSVERMINIVEDLQAISQLESGELELELEKFDIVILAKEILETQELKAKEKNISLLLLHDFDKPIFVMADRNRIRQVVTNLVVNSIRYGKESGETRIRFQEPGENIFMEIADNGIGISKEHLPRIFERFFRADKSRSREQGGTGLGLSIVKHIIEAHKQTIDVISTEGVGSAFTFTLKKG